MDSADLETAASQPAAMTNDTGSATLRPLNDLINMDRYLAGKAAQDGAAADGRLLRRGLRFAKAVPPSALGQ